MKILTRLEAKNYLLDNCLTWLLADTATGALLASGTNANHKPNLSYKDITGYTTNENVPKDAVEGITWVYVHCENTQAVKGKTAAETLDQRESVYGSFAVHAKAEQDMKKAMTSQPGWAKLNDVQKSAAEMVIHKLARVLNGSADYDDNWHDIAGYATLAERDIHNRKSVSQIDKSGGLN